MPDWIKGLKTHLNKYDALDKFRASLIDGRIRGRQDIIHVPVCFAISGCFVWGDSVRVFGTPTLPWHEIYSLWFDKTCDGGYGSIGMSRAELASLLKDTPTKQLLSYVRSNLAP